MKIRILAVGKIKDAWLKKGIDDYTRRIQADSAISIEEFPEFSQDKHSLINSQKEGERLLSRVRPDELVLVLDLKGKRMDSETFAHNFRRWMQAGGANITFVIGGSDGISPELRSRANQLISLSDLTFTHQMARLILVEQIYRAFKINTNHPYHK